MKYQFTELRKIISCSFLVLKLFAIAESVTVLLLSINTVTSYYEYTSALDFMGIKDLLVLSTSSGVMSAQCLSIHRSWNEKFHSILLPVKLSTNTKVGKILGYVHEVSLKCSEGSQIKTDFLLPLECVGFILPDT